MKSPREPKIMAELRAIRDAIYNEATQAGLDDYYDALNRRAGFFLGKLPAPRKRFSTRARAQKRRQCVAKLSVPAAVREVHAIRNQNQRRESESLLLLKERPKRDYGSKK